MPQRKNKVDEWPTLQKVLDNTRYSRAGVKRTNLLAALNAGDIASAPSGYAGNPRIKRKDLERFYGLDKPKKVDTDADEGRESETD